MSVVDYTTLQAAVKDWANRIDSSVSARVADFIRFGDDRIWRTNENGVIRSQWDIVNTTITIPAGQNWQVLPADWLEFARITIPGSVPAALDSNVVEYMSPDLLEDLSPPGDPNSYSIEGGRLIYGQPTQAGGTDVTLNIKYHGYPGTLDVVGSTWLLTKCPSVYLYAALVECAIYVKKWDLVPTYGALLDKAIAGFMSTEKASLVSGSRLRYRRP